MLHSILGMRLFLFVNDLFESIELICLVWFTEGAMEQAINALLE